MSELFENLEQPTDQPRTADQPWRSPIIRDLEAIAERWEAEATGYENPDPILAAHCSTIACCASELRSLIQHEILRERIALGRLSAELRRIEAEEADAQ